MKRFIPAIPSQDTLKDTLIDPKEDFSNAKKFQSIYIGNHYLFYRWLLINIKFIPIKDIARCYIRVDSCTSACCCARVPLDSKSLIVVTHGGKEKKLWLDNKRILDSIIEELRIKNNNIAVGRIPKTAQFNEARP